MDAEQAREWHVFEQEASRQLRAGEWTLRLSIMPSFSDWTVAGVTFRNQVVVRRWLREEDSCKFATPIERLRHPHVLTPTINESIEQVSKAEVDALTSGLDALAIAIRPQHERITLDGTKFGLVVHRASCWIEVHWSVAPTEWTELSLWFEETLKRLRQMTANDSAC
jgi:hypothetical protein